MAKELFVSVKDRIATKTGDEVYICGNSDYTVKFDFDSEWDGIEHKTARFDKRDGTFVDQVFTGNVCPVPILSDIYAFNIGVYAGNLHTTTPAYVPAKKSILCGGGLPANPQPDVYAQIMALLNSMKPGGSFSEENAGMLVCIGADGSLIPLTLGAGLAIVDGSLVVTNIQATAAICGQVLCGETICGEV